MFHRFEPIRETNGRIFFGLRKFYCPEKKYLGKTGGSFTPPGTPFVSYFLGNFTRKPATIALKIGTNSFPGKWSYGPLLITGCFRAHLAGWFLAAFFQGCRFRFQDFRPDILRGCHGWKYGFITFGENPRPSNPKTKGCFTLKNGPKI